MLTRIFHCDRCKEQGILREVALSLPSKWTRLHLEGPPGGYQYLLCPRCSTFLDELLMSFGAPSIPGRGQ